MEIRFWQSKSGRAPVERFISKQPPTHAARIMKEIDYLAKHGLNLLVGSDRLKSLTGHKNLYELKIDFQGVFYRILFCVKEGIVWLLEAFKKKGNHTPLNYITTAIDRGLAVGATIK